MKLIIRSILLFTLFADCLSAASFNFPKAGLNETMPGIQRKGDFRLHLIYPSPWTFMIEPNFNLNNEWRNDYDPPEYTGMHTSMYDKNQNVRVHFKNTILTKFGLGIEYNITDRISLQFSAKYWKIRNDWDTNYVGQIGYYQHLSTPLLLKYEFVRHPLVSFKGGIGFEPYIHHYQNVVLHRTYYSLFWKTDNTTTPINEIQRSSNSISDLTFELSGTAKLTKRLSIDYYLRGLINGSANHSQINLSYLLFQSKASRLQKKS
ncbi:MAG: hypothetical protein V4613_05030 [Bacteroidota bacterium]